MNQLWQRHFSQLCLLNGHLRPMYSGYPQNMAIFSPRPLLSHDSYPRSCSRSCSTWDRPAGGWVKRENYTCIHQHTSMYSYLHFSWYPYLYFSYIVAYMCIVMLLSIGIYIYICILYIYIYTANLMGLTGWPATSCLWHFLGNFVESSWDLIVAGEWPSHHNGNALW